MDREKINKWSLSIINRNIKQREKYNNLTSEEKQALLVHRKSKYQESKRRQLFENTSSQPTEMVP